MTYARVSLFVVVLLGFGVLALQQPDSVTSTPCSPSSLPARCYNITQPVCEVVWSHSAQTCKEWVKKFDLSPGRLIAPIIHQCQLLDLDSLFPYSKKATPECEQMSADLKDWKRRNL